MLDEVLDVLDLLDSLETVGEATKLYVNKNMTTSLDSNGRILVKSPENLQIYLGRVEKVYTDDFQAMMSRCIEKSYSTSLDLLIQFASTGRLFHWQTEEQVSTVHLKLLPEKYSINFDLYQKAKAAGFSDPWYDGLTVPYPGSEIAEKEAIGRYSGYRDAYHCFMYGPKTQWQVFFDHWDADIWDCTLSAADDFLNSRIPGYIKDQPREIIRQMKAFQR